MAEEVVAYIGASLWNAGYFEAGVLVEAYGVAALETAAFASSVYTMREQQRKAQNAQRAAYEASLKDRYVMVRSATEARQVVLGRQRVSGPLAYIGSYGANREHLVFTLILAAHEIDAVEAVYFDDEQVVLDGSGNVQAVNRRDVYSISAATGSFTLTSTPAAGSVVAKVAYGTTVVTLGATVSGDTVSVTGATAGSTGTLTIQYQPAQSPWVTVTADDITTAITTDGAGTGSVTVATTPSAVRVFWGDPTVLAGDTSNNAQDLTSYTSVSGNTITVTGCPYPSAALWVQYRSSTFSSKARVKAYLGAAGQAADADMIAALPGVWTSAHTMTGLAYLRVELDYDTDAFPSGLPNVSAVVRGAKLYDPRTATTAWSANPALMMRHVATSSLLGRLSTSYVNDTSIAAAATICDASTAYLVNGQTYTRPLYAAGLTLKSDVRAKDALDDLAKAMAGRWCFVDGQMRVKAGAYVTPLQTLDDSWLTSGQAVQVQPKTARGDVLNVASGKFADESRDYLVTDYPRVTAAAYVTEDGAELPIDIQLNAVTFIGQAQQVVAAQMRDARAGMRLTLTCNMRAYCVEPFDTLNVTLSRFGWVNKVFEVLDVSWQIDGIQLVLKETASSIWDLGSSFAATDPAANTLFPSPWKLPAVTTLACASGTGQLLRQADGTVMTRVQVTWDAISDIFVTEGGGVEIRYGLATTPESTWQSVDAPTGQSRLYLTENLRDGQLYLVKARAYNALVRGTWCVPVLHKVIGKTAVPANVTGLSGAASRSRIVWTWTACTDADYDVTEARLGGSDWASATTPPAFKGTANTYVQPVTATGSYTLRVRHIDNTGNLSAATTSATVTVATADLVPDNSSILNSNIGVNLDGTLNNTGTGAPNLANIAGTVSAAQISDDYLIVNVNGHDITTELRLNRTTGGWASFYWDGVNLTTNKPLIPADIGINRISTTLPSSPFAYQVCLITP